MFTIIITAIAGILIGLISGFIIARKNVIKEMEGQLLRERELLKAEFRATAGELMEEKRESLSSANKEQLNPLVQQLREQLEKVEKQLASTREYGARENARLEQIIKEMGL